MLKLYVDCQIRLQHASNKLRSPRNDDGFVSAETIALAVAGVLIVGGIWAVFRTQLESVIDGLAERITGIESNTGTPG